MLRYRFDRKGNVVPDRRRLAATFDTDAYIHGDLLYAPKRSSRARAQFKAARWTKRHANAA